MYKVIVMYDESPENNPMFTFEKFDEFFGFIEICFSNGYDVLVKKE